MASERISFTNTEVRACRVHLVIAVTMFLYILVRPFVIGLDGRISCSV